MMISIVMASKDPDIEKFSLAINSILRQTYEDFELIIVDDGSMHPIEHEIYAICNDKRIKVFRIDHSGLGAALNYGISKSSGKYIARLDDDDLMNKNRLLKQFEYLEAHLEVSCVGTQIYDKVGNRYRKHRHFPENHDDIMESMLTNIRFQMAHTSFMFRRAAFDSIGGYRVAGGGQDLDLIFQMSRVGKVANLREYLTYYTMSAFGLGTLNPDKQKAYLFAFTEILSQNVYPQYKRQIEDSIKRLKSKIDNRQGGVVKTFILRNLLVLRVIILGHKFDFSKA